MANLRSRLISFVFMVSAVVLGLVDADDRAPFNDLVLIEVDLPSKVVYDVEVVGRLPHGLVYEGESLSIDGAASSASVSQINGGPNDGCGETVITWSFGNIDNRAGQDMKIAFRAVMADVASNRGDEVLPPIIATVGWRDQGGATYSSSDESDAFRIVEPALVLVRETNAAFIAEGDSVTFDFSFSHSTQSSSTAFDVDVVEDLPEGINYIPGSMEILIGPAGIMDDSDPSGLRWHFDEVDSTWDEARNVVLRYKAIVRSAGDHGRLTGRALLTWSSTPGDNPDEREYFASSENSLDLQLMQGLTIAQEDLPDPISPGGFLNYTINFQSVAQDSHGCLVKETYDEDVIFLSATPPPDEDTNDCWTFDDLLQGETGAISIGMQVKPSAKPGTKLESRVEIRSADGHNASGVCITTVKGWASLSIENRASSDLLSPGGSLNYTLTFRNNGDIDATNVTVSDIIDGDLEFNADEDAAPKPTRIWKDYQGTHLWWNAKALGLEVLRPGGSGRINISVRLPAEAKRASVDRVYNLYKVDSDQSAGAFQLLETFIAQSLFVRKKADKGVCSGGDVLNYTILYGNKLDVPASDAVIMDKLPDVEFLAASPEPDYLKDNLLAWRVGTIFPQKSGSIHLSVRVRTRPEINFQDSQSIYGRGRVVAQQRLSTAKQSSSLTNYVNITAFYPTPTGTAHDSSYSSTKLSDALGVDVEAMQHGSGYYAEMRLINYSEKGISFERHLSVLAKPSNSNQNCSSSWANRISARNNLRDESVSESHFYTDRMEKEDFLLLDRNQTVFSNLGDYSGGIARFRYAKHPTAGSDSTLDISEDYHGNFKSDVHLDSYGRDVSYARQASGAGFVSADMRQSSELVKQRSYEHGSGSYRLGDLLTFGSTIHKDVLMNYTASHQSAGSFGVSYASKWSEGMYSADREYGSQIGADIRQGDYIRKEGLMDSSSLAMMSEFSGMGSIEVAAGKERRESWQLDQVFLGSYKLDVTLGISRIPSYLCPHLNVTKRIVRSEGDIVHFRINITNDGNKTISSLEVIDRLPLGLAFINSSLRPEIDGQNVRWRLLSMPIGGVRTIDLQARWDPAHPAVINEVEAGGYFGNQTITAEAFCAFPCGHECLQSEHELNVSGNSAGFQGGQWKPSPCMEVAANLSVCTLEDGYSDYEGKIVECGCPL